MSITTMSGAAGPQTAGLFLAATLIGVATLPSEPMLSPTPVPMERCSKALRELYGEPASEPATGGKAPKSLRSPRPKYPERKAGTCSAGAVHEVLIDPGGNVRQVWVVREPTCTPAWPELGDAILGAVRLWKYEPATLNGRPVPFCVIITTNIHWR